MNVKTINAHCVVVYTRDANGYTYSATVYSYDTPVLHYDGGTETFHRLWGGYSATTVKDINRSFPWQKMTKKQWDSMPIETL